MESLSFPRFDYLVQSTLGTARDLVMELFQHHVFMFADYDTFEMKHLHEVLVSDQQANWQSCWVCLKDQNILNHWRSICISLNRRKYQIYMQDWQYSYHAYTKILWMLYCNGRSLSYHSINLVITFLNHECKILRCVPIVLEVKVPIIYAVFLWFKWY